MNQCHIAHRRKKASKQHLAHLQGTLPPSHALYIVERGADGQDAETGLPTGGTLPPELMHPAPHVVIGGDKVVTEGGATLRVGDAVVSQIRREFYPLSRLLAAVGFHIDDPDGELYQILDGDVVEVGLHTYSLTLTRMSQPRD